MMKLHDYIILVFLIGFLACEKSNLPPEDTNPDLPKTVFEIEWATPLSIEKEVANLNNGKHYKDWYIYSGDLSDPPTIMAFNKITGNKDWEYSHKGLDNTDEITYSRLVDNYYLAVTGKSMFVFDLENRISKWQYSFREHGLNRDKGPIIHNDHIYISADENFSSATTLIDHLLRFNLYSGEMDTIISWHPDSLGTKIISPPCFWTDTESGKELIIFNLDQNGFDSPAVTNQDMVALDLKTKKIVWHTENISEFFPGNSRHPPIIHNNVVMTGGDWSMYGFDVKTGEKLWRTEIPENDWFSIFTNTNHLIHDDRLYVNEGGDHVTCLNPETGKIIWDNPMGGANCTDNMVYYEKEDLLVFTAWGYGSVMVLDALTGETIHREPKYADSQFNNDVVYDPETDMFFTSTYKHAFGFKVNRP